MLKCIDDPLTDLVLNLVQCCDVSEASTVKLTLCQNVIIIVHWPFYILASAKCLQEKIIAYTVDVS